MDKQDQEGKDFSENYPDKVGDDLEEKFDMNETRSGELELGGQPPGDEIDINNEHINDAAAEAVAVDELPVAAVAPPVGDEIDVMNDNVVPPPVIDFNQLDNALQHVQGHMDTMMHNLGGLQSSVKHLAGLKNNLNQLSLAQKSHENERNSMKVSLHSDVLQSWKDGSFSDLVLVDDAGCHHKVHKVVLASRSPYFKAQLTNWDKDESVLEIKIVSSDILKIVLEFIYTLDVQSQINNNNVVELLQAANIYDLKLLREECVMFLKQRIRVVNIIEILTFSHIDFSLEAHASDFLARNFSTFLSSPDKKLELLELPVDKMKLVLNSKLLVLRDEFSFPLKSVEREGKILDFVLEYLHHREDQRMSQAAKLLSMVKLYLLPLHRGIAFSEDRFLPDSVLELMATKLADNPEAVKLLKQTELDIKTLHSQTEPGQLYQLTKRREKEKEKARLLGDRHPGWELSVAREASVCHEWWTAHAHDSRFVPLSNNNVLNSKIVGVSGAAGRKKFIKKITFYLGDVNDNSDLLPEWFNLAPQYGMNNMSQELGEYIGALHIVWSCGTENRIGDHGDLKRGVSVSLEEGEHIIKTFQLFWGPRHVFVPLEIVDFIFYTSKGRKFGPFTKQVRKSCEEGEVSRRPDGWAQVSHKLNCRKISRRVDSPLVPMCRPATLNQVEQAESRSLEEDTNWAAWLDGFLCVTRRGKITRITLKFAVYLNCFYMERKLSSGPPVLYSYTLKDLRDNMTGPAIKILDQDYLWEQLIAPLSSPQDEDTEKGKKRNLLNNLSGGGQLEYGVSLSLPNPDLMGPVLLHLQPQQHPAHNNEEPDPPNNQQEAPEAAPEEPAGEAEDEPNIHDHVWDALINDDLRQIGDLYERKNINVENYLE